MIPDQNTHRDQRGRDSHARAEIDRGRSASTGGSPERLSVFLLGSACAACTSRPRALQSTKGGTSYLIRLIHHYVITDLEGKAVMEVEAQHVRQVSDGIEIVTDGIWLLNGAGFTFREVEG